jgi:hypothetical protein
MKIGQWVKYKWGDTLLIGQILKIDHNDIAHIQIDSNIRENYDIMPSIKSCGKFAMYTKQLTGITRKEATLLLMKQ